MDLMLHEINCEGRNVNQWGLTTKVNSNFTISKRRQTVN